MILDALGVLCETNAQISFYETNSEHQNTEEPVMPSFYARLRPWESLAPLISQSLPTPRYQAALSSAEA